MKKLLHTIFIAAFAFSMNAGAQVIQLEHKTVLVETFANDEEAKNATSILTNGSINDEDSIVSWNIIEFDIPSGWQFDFCDPFDCKVDLQLNSTNTFILRKGEKGPLKGQFYSKDIPGNATVKLAIQIQNKPETSDTLTLLAKGWSTGLTKVKNASEIGLFPNPTNNQITFKYNTTKPIEVSIYNVLGAKVKSFNHMGTETLVNVTDLQKGVYFIRFNTGSAIYSKSFTKVD